ncbi:hypothetical protein MHY86_08695 [Aerococcus urinaeequi]|uniref:hypothetical protein n=1 Tax=Aerococcus urinaeequi TaxID=51665 RepID=UPI00228235B3|nr:hypothetical protein [Aerococcus urinaeequi]MCY7731776.1 hypothetical protein [Aerococcus urinaeequi]
MRTLAKPKKKVIENHNLMDRMLAFYKLSLTYEIDSPMFNVINNKIELEKIRLKNEVDEGDLVLINEVFEDKKKYI